MDNKLEKGLRIIDTSLGHKNLACFVSGIYAGVKLGVVGLVPSRVSYFQLS